MPKTKATTLSKHNGKGHTKRGRPSKESALIQAARKLIAADERQGKPLPTAGALTCKLLESERFGGEEASTACRAAQLALIMNKRPSDITLKDKKFLASRRVKDLRLLESLEADGPELAHLVEWIKRISPLQGAACLAIESIIGRRLTLDEQGQLGALMASLMRATPRHTPRS